MLERAGELTPNAPFQTATRRYSTHTSVLPSHACTAHAIDVAHATRLAASATVRRSWWSESDPP